MFSVLVIVYPMTLCLVVFTNFSVVDEADRHFILRCGEHIGISQTS